MPGGYKNIKGSDAKGFDKHPENINRKGRPPILPELDVLLAEVLSEQKGDITVAKALLMSLRNKGMKGDVRAIDLMLNRAYGKQVEKFEGALIQLEIPKIEISFRDAD